MQYLEVPDFAIIAIIRISQPSFEAKSGTNFIIAIIAIIAIFGEIPGFAIIAIIGIPLQ